MAEASEKVRKALTSSFKVEPFSLGSRVLIEKENPYQFRTVFLTLSRPLKI